MIEEEPVHSLLKESKAWLSKSLITSLTTLFLLSELSEADTLPEPGLVPTLEGLYLSQTFVGAQVQFVQVDLELNIHQPTAS